MFWENVSRRAKRESSKKKENVTVSWELLIENTSDGADISTMILREGFTQSWIWRKYKKKTFAEKHQIKTNFLKMKKWKNQMNKCKKGFFLL